MELWSQQFYQSVNPEILRVGIDLAVPGYEGDYLNRSKADYFDILYVFKGKGTLKIDDQWTEHCAGDVIFITPGQNFQMERADSLNPYGEYYVHFHPFGVPDHPAAKSLKRVCPLKINSKNRILPAMFKQLFEIFTTSPEDGSIKLKYIMLQIIEIIFYQLKYKSGRQNLRTFTKILSAQKFIEQNFTQVLTIDQIAERADISGSYLMLTFKRYFGCSPMSYKLNLQINHAKLLLAQNVSVSETARRSGFNSLHYFSRMFSQKAGMPPTQFVDVHSRKIL